jgi:haloalkane dehalogenase
MGNVSKEAAVVERAETNPPWVDAEEYPFAPRYIEIDGTQLHYVDEGQGEPIVLVHGTPTWSFLYRRQIKTLSQRFRCVAVDNLGFGLSDKPTNAAWYPQDHARRLETVIERLGLRDITLIVHDFGGPIGLHYALRHPANVRRIVLFNTWMWSLANEPKAQAVDRLVRGALGNFLYRKMNLSPRFLLPKLVQDRSKLPPPIHQQYILPFPTPESRTGMLSLARALVGSSPWYDELWTEREAIRQIPAILLWGMKDPTFCRQDLERWQTVFANHETIPFPEAGHFVQEEVEAEVLNEIIERFIAAHP